MTFKTNSLGDMVAYNNDHYLMVSGRYEIEKQVLTEWDEQRFELWEDLEPIMFAKRYNYATAEFCAEMDAIMEGHYGN